METIKIKLDGKIYEFNFSFSPESLKKLKELKDQVDITFDAEAEAIEIITGIQRERVLKLKRRTINTIRWIIFKEAKKALRLLSH